MPEPSTLGRSRHILGAVALSCALVLSATATGQPAPDEPAPDQPKTSFDVHFVGNRLLLEPVLQREIVDVFQQSLGPSGLADLVEARLSVYLEETGFALARVEALVYKGDLWVFVDEGRLNRIFFVGAGSVQTARMQLEFELPGQIYNRIQLQRELAMLQAEYQLRNLQVALVAEPDGPAESTQPLRRRLIAALQTGDDQAEEVWRDAGGRYSLRIAAIGREWGRGLSFGLDLIGPYGLEGTVGYSGTDLASLGDRYSVEIVLAGLSDPFFTHAVAEVFYAGPELLDESIRPAIDVDASLESLERESLDLDSSLYLQTAAVALVSLEPLTNLVVSQGVGYGYDNMLSLERGDDTPDFVTVQQRSFLIGEIGLEWLISRVGFRRDELHLLEAIIEMRPVEEGLWTRVEGDYQKAWAIGANDLFLRSNFFSFLGSGIEWYDEDPIASQVIRAVPGEHDFARNLLALGTEFRLSIHDDLVKAGLSASAAGTELHNRQTRQDFFELFASGGPGLHLQLLDNFQLNLFYHYGWRDDGGAEGRFSLKFWKVY